MKIGGLFWFTGFSRNWVGCGNSGGNSYTPPLMGQLRFQEIAKDSKTHARAGILKIRDLKIPTPVFMPVGTRATVKTLDSQDVQNLGYDLILGNTYHLYLKPGTDILEEAGGLHRFMNWPGVILTDSGGFQIFSLKELRKIDADGVTFRSIYDGSRHRFEPESCIRIQRKIGSDIMMAFDECPPGDAPRDYVARSMEITHRWALRSLAAYQEDEGHQNLFGIFQGGVHEDLRRESLDFIQSQPFDGIAIGGLSVGESREDMQRILQSVASHLDPARPHYLMGVGTPIDFLNAVENGVDMFDCVMPTRVARHGRAYTSEGALNLLNARFRQDFSPLDGKCSCYACENHSRAYVHHLLRAQEYTGARLLTLHNLAFFRSFLAEMREAILQDGFLDFRKSWEARL